MMQGERVVNIAQSLNNPSGTRPKFSRQSISPCRTLDESWTRLLCPREMMREVGRWTKAALCVCGGGGGGGGRVNDDELIGINLL